MADTVDLTITIDARTAARAERYLARQGTTLVRVVEQLLARLPEPPEPDTGLSERERALPPRTRRLREIAHSGRMLGADGPVDWKIVEAELRAEDERLGRL
jgi:hypothetical protein